MKRMINVVGKSIGELGKRGALCGLRVADRKTAEATEALFGVRVSFYGLYKGWVTGSEREWQEHVKLGSAKGEDFRQAITSLPGNIVSLISSGEYKKYFINKVDHKLEIDKLKDSYSSIASRAYELASELKAEEILVRFNSAILKQDFQEAKIYLLAKAIKTGEVDKTEEAKLLNLDSTYRASNDSFSGSTVLFFDQLNLAKNQFKYRK